MTESDIIKALNYCCGNIENNDEECNEDMCYQVALSESRDNGIRLCRQWLIKDALDLINRQKAGIERLENKKYIKIVKCIATNMYEEKSKVIKEFADRLKNIADKTTIKYVDDYGKVSFLINEVDLDNLVKEMTENDFKEE